MKLESIPASRTVRDTTARLERLARRDELTPAEKQSCLRAAEWLRTQDTIMQRLDAAEAYLHDEVRRLETALACLWRRAPRRPEAGGDVRLVDHVRRLKAELKQALPVEPRSRPFGATTDATR